MNKNTEKAWSKLKLILFRFGFVYLALYSFCSPLALISAQLFPIILVPIKYYNYFWRPVVIWTGKVLFGKDLSFQIIGGDSTYGFVLVFCFLLISLFVTILWTLIDRERKKHSRLFQYSYIFVRYTLAFILIFYGASKVIPSQFISPELHKLLQPFGDSSPMGLLWGFMGYSYPFIIFTGLGETIGGLLLIFKRTVLLGTLILLPIMTTVVAMNFSYDVPVKLFSVHILFMCLILLTPHLKRLINLILLNKNAEPVTYTSLFNKPWLNRTLSIGGKAFIILYLIYQLNGSYQSQFTKGSLAHKSTYYGIWNVEELKIDGEDQPLKLSNRNRWRRFIFDKPNVISIQLVSDEIIRFRLKENSNEKTFNLSRRDGTKANLKYVQPSTNILELEGTYNNKTLKAKLEKDQERKFLLYERSFNLINDKPLNR